MNIKRVTWFEDMLAECENSEEFNVEGLKLDIGELLLRVADLRKTSEATNLAYKLYRLVEKL